MPGTPPALSSPDRERLRITRRRGACSYCRQKKIRCNGEHPCRLCQRHGVNCSYLSPSDSASSSTREPRMSRHRQTPSGNSPSLENYTRSPSESLEVNPMEWIFKIPTPSTEASNNPPPESVFSPLTEFVWSHEFPHEPIMEIAELERSRLSSAPSMEAMDPAMQVADLSQLNPRMKDSSSDRIAAPVNSFLDPRWSIWKAKSEIWPSWIGRKQMLLFPAMSNLDSRNLRPPPPFNPHVLSLVSKLSNTNVNGAYLQTLTDAFSCIMSRECHYSLPAAWWQDSQLGVDLASLPLESFISHCFEEPLGVSLYLEQQGILTILTKLQDRAEPQMSVVERSTASTLLAWGCLLKDDQQTVAKVELVALAIDAHEILGAEPDTLEKFFALVAMLQLAHKLGLQSLGKILTSVIAMMQSLSLHSEAALDSLCKDTRGLTTRLKRACWVVFCAEKLNTLRCKSFSQLPGQCLLYPPPPAAGYHEGDWFLAQCTYAQICGKVQNGRYLTGEQRLQNATALTEELRAWQHSVAGGEQQRNTNHGNSKAAMRLNVVAMYQYCEACLALLDNEEAPTETLECNLGTRLETISIIRDIFRVCNRVEPEDLLYDQILLFAPSFALCRLATEVMVHGTNDFKDARAVLAVAHGYFARISSALPIHTFFDKVTELVEVAANACRR